MAQAPTLYQFDLSLNHTDRGVSQDFLLRTPRHPSETMLRLWLRVLAYCWHWQERLVFGVGLSDPEATDLFADDLQLTKTLLVRVGKPEPSKVQRDVDQNGRASVAVFFESPERMKAFVDAAEKEGLKRLGKVELAAVDPALVTQLARDEERRIKASITIAGDHFYIETRGANFDGAVERSVAR